MIHRLTLARIRAGLSIGQAAKLLGIPTLELVDPPYCPEYAASLYGIEYPLPKHLLVEATRVVRPSGRIVFVHYITPKPVPGMTFVKSFWLSIGFDMPMRAVSIYERDQSELAL